MKHFIIVAETMDPKNGGGEVFMNELIHSLINVIDCKIEIIANDGPRFELDNIKTHYLKQAFHFDRRSANLWQHIARIIIIILLSIKLQSVLKTTNNAEVVTHHQTLFPIVNLLTNIYKTKGSGIVLSWMDTFTRFKLRYLLQLVLVRLAPRYILSIVPIPILRPTRFTTINNFVADAFFVSEPTSKSVDKLNLIFVGKPVVEKGIIITLNSYKKLVEENRVKSSLKIVGGSPESKLMEGYGQLSNLVSIDHVTQLKLADLYDQSNILILPSYSEGFPTVLIEACARNCIVVVTKVGNVNKLVKEGFIFFVVDRNHQSVVNTLYKISSLTDGVIQSMLRKNRLLSQKYKKRVVMDDIITKLIDKTYH